MGVESEKPYTEEASFEGGQPAYYRQFQPGVFYQPVPYEVSVNGEDQASNAQGQKKCFISRLCNRWRNRKCQRKQIVDDGRALGNLNNFILGLLFGFFSPFFSLLCVFGFESKKLTRTGVLYGHANLLLLLAFGLLAFRAAPRAYTGFHGAHNLTLPAENTTLVHDPSFNVTASELHPEVPQGDLFSMSSEDDEPNQPEQHKRHKEKGEHRENHQGGKHREERKRSCQKMLKKAIWTTFALGMVFLFLATRSLSRFMVIYKMRENKAEADMVKSVSNAGTLRGFFLSMIVSLLWPMVGTALVILVRRKHLADRYGAIHGLAVFFVCSGIVLALHGVPPIFLLKGMVLSQIAAVHFKRAIADAAANDPKHSLVQTL
jgi:hypothetical protein